MLKRITLIIISVGLVFGVSAGDSKVSPVQKSLEKIMAKSGVLFSGEFKSEYFSSNIKGDGADDSLRSSETNEYASVDFDVSARPNSAISGRLIFRMHHNWQNFFSDIANPINSRWISIDGNPKDIFRFSVGDFKEKYSPLTLYTPEINILFEPYIFERQRQLAMDEFFLGDNNRILQGVNFGMDAEIDPLFNEFHLGFVGARLKSRDIHSGNGNTAVQLNEAADDGFTQYLTGGNFDLIFLKGVDLGITDLFIFDHKASYGQNDSIATELAEKTNVFSVRPGINIGKTFDLPEEFKLNLSTEFAISADYSTDYIDEKNDFVDSVVNGTAINIHGDIGYSSGETFSVKLGASVISNNRDFINPLAQTPSFVGSRIMNFENDNPKGANHYSTFDALYHSVYKTAFKANTNGFMKGPAMKTSYFRGIWAKEVFGAFDPDPSVQLVMPFGPATPNRVGISTDLHANFINESIELAGLFASLTESEVLVDSSGYSKTGYTQMGGGINVSIDKMVDVISQPFTISASAVSSSAKNNGELSKIDITSNFINAGVYYNFWKKLAFLAGFQTVITSDTFTGIDTTVSNEPVEMTTVQTTSHWAAGLEWSVADGASVVGNIGQILMKNDATAVKYYGKDWNQMLIDISLHVKF